jgi:hypothetical protein
MSSWAYGLGLWGVVLANVMLLSVRSFARSQGLKVRWWHRSFSRERERLQSLARGPDAALAQKARLFLRIEIASWVVFVLSAVTFFWGVARK